MEGLAGYIERTDMKKLEELDYRISSLEDDRRYRLAKKQGEEVRKLRADEDFALGVEVAGTTFLVISIIIVFCFIVFYVTRA